MNIKRYAQQLTPILFVVAVLMLPAESPCRADDETGGEFGVLGGVTSPDKDLLGTSDGEAAFGLRGGAVFSTKWGWFIDALYSNIDTPTGEVDSITSRLALDRLFNPAGKARWFFSFGVGHLSLGSDNPLIPDQDGPMATIGIGQRIKLGGRSRLRWEIRGDRTLDDNRFGGERVTQGHAVLGLLWGPGDGSPADTDGDGVVDRKDNCPNTPRGAMVDTMGCPLDSDEDGVPDGIDRCPGTPRAWPVDASGCPLDGDEDGVADGGDACPDTPRGARVDARGCPTDSDGDGVFDGLDRCPDTPRGAMVDALGCPKDSDGDGVFDGLDRCPDTPRGAMVDALGCPKDSDGDGVFDGLDRCPGTPRGVKVDSKGCQVLFDETRKTFVLEGVQFEFDSARLTARAEQILDRVAMSLVQWPEVRVEVGGHTDSKGSDTYNLRLSRRRADAVRAYLAGKGVSPERMTSRGYGESLPIADNATKAGRDRNRRVELKRSN